MNKGIQVIALANAKGGVGKTQLCLNLGVALAEMQRRVVLLDGDLALGKLALAAKLSAKADLASVIESGSSLREIMLEGPRGVRIIPAARGKLAMTRVNTHQQAALIHSFNGINEELDVLLVDTSSGLWSPAINLIAASQEVLLVVSPDAASVEDALALIRELNLSRSLFRFRVVCNMVRNAEEGRQLFERLSSGCDSGNEESLEVALHYLGYVPMDECLRQAAQTQESVLESAPESRASQSIRALAQKLTQLPRPESARGNLEFFVESLVGVGN